MPETSLMLNKLQQLVISGFISFIRDKREETGVCIYIHRVRLPLGFYLVTIYNSPLPS